MPVPQDVSVCLITKDEPYLQKALEHVRPWVRQIVVVLTGGTLTPAETAMIDTLVEFDGMDPALKHPATGVPVFNFGLARNKSFELARCKHVMWIDADDEVAGLEHLENEICVSRGPAARRAVDVSVRVYVRPPRQLHAPSAS